MKNYIVSFLAAAFLLSAADAPDGINYQGKLFEGGGPVDGETRDFRFRLFTDVNGDGDFDDPNDTLSWTDGDTSGVEINGGLFSVVLDGISDYLDHDSLYLAVFVKKPSETDYTFLGSERLWSAPYALKAAGSVGGSGADNYLARWDGTTNLQSSSVYVTDGGNVGIGTASPSEKLTVTGDVGLREGALWQPVYPSDDGLVLYLPFREGTGTTTYDKSPYGNDGTIYGAAWTDGKYGKALEFDGSNDYVSLPDNSILDFDASSSFTWAVWIKTTCPWSSGDRVVIGWRDSEDINPFIRIIVKYNGLVGFTYRDAGGTWTNRVESSPNTVNDGNWHFIVAVRDKSSANPNKLYVDGVLVDESTDPTTLGFDVDHHEIGRDYISGAYFDGTIDEVRIYNRALSAEEIRVHYLHCLQSHGYIMADNFKVINTSADELLRVTSSGNVGIGTTSPNELLTVEGVLSLVETSAPSATLGYGKLYVKSSDGKLYFMDDGGTEYDLTAGGGTPGGGNGAVQFNNSGSFGGDENNLFWDNTNKRLGIGTASPGSKLDVEGGYILVTNSETGSGELRIGAVNGLPGLYSNVSGKPMAIRSDTGLRLAGHAVHMATGTPDLNIDVSGNVGIGTTSPEYKLDVEGDVDLNYNRLRNTILFPTGYDGRSANLMLPAFSDLVYYAVERGLSVTVNRGPDAGSLSDIFDLHRNSGAVWNNVNTTPVTITIDLNGTPYVKLIGIAFGSRNSQAIDYQIEVYEDDDNNGTYQWTTIANVTGNSSYEVAHYVDMWRVDQIRIHVTDAGDGDHDGDLNIATIQVTSPLSGKATGHLLDVGGDTMYGDLYIMNNGNLGIGTTSPNELLTVEGVLSLVETSAPSATSGYGKLYVKSSDGKLYFMDDGGTEYDLTAGGGTPGGGNGAVQFNNSGSFSGDENNLFWDNTNKRLGIGTASPGSRLDVEGGYILVTNSEAGSGELRIGAVNGLPGLYSNVSGKPMAIRSDTGLRLAGHAVHMATGTPDLNIDVSGNVGIGTTSPTEKLDVEGNIEMNSNQIKNVATPTTGESAVGYAVSTEFLYGDEKASSTNFKLYWR